MARIFVVTLFVSIIAFTKSLETIEVSRGDNNLCKLSTLPQELKFTIPSIPGSRCWVPINIKYCVGSCTSSQTSYGKIDHQVCSYEGKARKRQGSFTATCYPDISKTYKLELTYYEPERCRCSLCDDSDTYCDYLSGGNLDQNLTLINPSSNWSMAGEKGRRGNPSQSSYPKYLEFVPLAGEKDRRGNPPGSKSQSSYLSYLGFIPSAEWKDQEENPPRSVSQLYGPRYPAVMRSTGNYRWNIRKRWGFNFPPSPQYQVYYT